MEGGETGMVGIQWMEHTRHQEAEESLRAQAKARIKRADVASR
jgi:hypothetical protein